MQLLPRPVLLSLALVAPLAAQSSLTTIWTGGNSLNAPGANVFDITVLNPGGIVITALDVNCENSRNGPLGSSFLLEVWLTLRGGTYVGNAANPSVWQLVAEGTGVSGPTGTPTNVDIADVFLPPGAYGIGIRYTTTVAPGTAFTYTNGNGVNQTYSNADLQLNLGSSVSGTFNGAIYDPRVWNGTIHYEAGSVAAYGVHGRGCSGGAPLGEPTLRPGPTWPVPRLGNPFELTIGNLAATTTAGALAFSANFAQWGGASLPLDLGPFGMPSCTAFLSPDTVVFFAHAGGGSVQFLVGIPSRTALTGLTFGTQAMLIDPTATNPLQANVTNLAGGRVGT
jgi:hypothetical protein